MGITPEGGAIKAEAFGTEDGELDDRLGSTL
jgi:hypothetical protein